MRAGLERHSRISCIRVAPIGKLDAMQLAHEIIRVVMADEGAHHIPLLHHRFEHTRSKIYQFRLGII